MNTIKSSSDGERTEIKINRKMRMWHKYKNYCIMGGSAIAVILVLVLVVNLWSGKGRENIDNPQGTKDYANNSTTGVNDTKPNDSSGEASSEEATTPAATEPSTPEATEPSTPEPVTEPSTPATGSRPEQQTFTTKDKFQNSVFVGDTIVNGMSYYKFVDASQVDSNLNMVSEHAAASVNRIVSAGTDKLFIMVGLNDANYENRTTDSIVDNIGKAVAAAKAKKSSVQVYILSVMPVTSEFEAKSNVNIKQSYLNELNYKLSTKAAGMGASYIDVATAFKDGSGYLYSDCTGNGSSLKKEYYPYLLNRIAGSL